MAKADENQWLRRLPLIVGSVGGTLLMLNRLLTPVLTASQARADVVGVFLSAILILTTLLWRQIQPVPPEAVILEGEEGLELANDVSDSIATELAWASHLLLTNTVTRTLVAYYDGQILLRRGVLGSNKEVEVGPILERVLTQKKPVYLVSLKLYPGKIEFNYLPENTQGIICQPMGDKGVLILGANAPRSYTKQDEAWIEGIADKLGASLDALPTPQVPSQP
ncbi:MAG: cofactor assembly of complex C subunit B [Cyanobacteria bacterium P01_C01_bin.118]